MSKSAKKKPKDAEQQVKDSKGANAAKQSQPDMATSKLTLVDIERLLTSTEERIVNKLSAQLSANRASIEENQDSIQQLETSVTDIQERLELLEAKCAVLEKDNEVLREKVDDLENRSRRNNVRIIGLPEKVEGKQPTAFVDTLLREVFGQETFPTPMIAERAHRIAITKTNPNDNRPRPFIMRIHHFQTKERILTLARETGSIYFRGTQIHFFPDFSAETSRKRAAFFPVKSQLKDAGIGYRMLFPAKLQVTGGDGKKHVFQTVDDATRFAKRFQASVTEEPPLEDSEETPNGLTMRE